MSKFVFVCIVLLLTTSAAFAAAYPPGLYAELQTNKGLIVLRLEFEKAPLTVANFVGLAEGRITTPARPKGTPFYSGSKFHRVVPGHVIQAGIPAVIPAVIPDGVPTGAPDGDKEDGPGYAIPNEIVPGLSHDRAGVLGMANAGPHTNGSQFYITLGDRSYLDGMYTVFGEVVQGLDVVMAVVQDDVIQSVRIVRVGRAAQRFRVDDASFRRRLAAAHQQVKEAAEARRRSEAAQIASTWPDLQQGENGVQWRILQPGDGDAPAAGARLKVRYTASILNGKEFFSSVDEGKPMGDGPAEAFVCELGKTQVTPGLDAMVGRMKRGEKRLVVVPAAQGYGQNGFFAKSRPGVRRFVLPPDATLVYWIELLDIL